MEQLEGTGRYITLVLLLAYIIRILFITIKDKREAGSLLEKLYDWDYSRLSTIECIINAVISIIIIIFIISIIVTYW